MREAGTKTLQTRNTEKEKSLPYHSVIVCRSLLSNCELGLGDSSVVLGCHKLERPSFDYKSSFNFVTLSTAFGAVH